MKLNYIKTNPTQNMTILVTDPVSRAAQPQVAARLMGYDSVYAEQVGFVEPAALDGARARLQMMGGEFCGNASMSLGAVIAREDGLEDGKSALIPLEVSGAAGLVNCRITRMGAAYRGAVEMPLPQEIVRTELLPGVKLPVVHFPGIAHVIVPEDLLNIALAESYAAKWCEGLQAEAVGVMFVSADFKRMRPLVYVQATHSGVWERGCGSGTAAVGAYAAAKNGSDVELEIDQPGGRIAVRAAYAGAKVRRIEIEGTVRIAAEGAAYIDA